MWVPRQGRTSKMVLSIEELKALASNLMKEGLNTQQIADELSLSQDTITSVSYTHLRAHET